MSTLISSPEHQCNLLFAVQRFVEKEEYVDVTIKCCDGAVKAHSLLLATASPFLKHLLESHCVGCRQEIVVLLPDVKYDFMYSVLNFLYTGFMKVDESDLEEFYDVLGLLQIDIRALAGEDNPFKDLVSESKDGTGQNFWTALGLRSRNPVTEGQSDSTSANVTDAVVEGEERNVLPTPLDSSKVPSERPVLNLRRNAATLDSPLQRRTKSVPQNQAVTVRSSEAEDQIEIKEEPLEEAAESSAAESAEPMRMTRKRKASTDQQGHTEHVFGNLKKQYNIQVGPCNNCMLKRKKKNTYFGCLSCMTRLCSERCFEKYHVHNKLAIEVKKIKTESESDQTSDLTPTSLGVPLTDNKNAENVSLTHELDNLYQYGMKIGKCTTCFQTRGRRKLTQFGCRTCLQRFCSRVCLVKYHDDIGKKDSVDDDVRKVFPEGFVGHYLDNLIKFGVKVGKCENCCLKNVNRQTRFGCHRCLIRLCSYQCSSEYHKRGDVKIVPDTKVVASPKPLYVIESKSKLKTHVVKPPVIKVPKQRKAVESSSSFYVVVSENKLKNSPLKQFARKNKKHVFTDIYEHGIEVGWCVVCLNTRKKTATRWGCHDCLKQLCSKGCFEKYHKDMFETSGKAVVSSASTNGEHVLSNAVQFGTKGGRCENVLCKNENSTHLGCSECCVRLCSTNCLSDYHKTKSVVSTKTGSVPPTVAVSNPAPPKDVQPAATVTANTTSVKSTAENGVSKPEATDEHTLINLYKFGMKVARCVYCLHVDKRVKYTEFGCQACLKRLCSKGCFSKYHTQSESGSYVPQPKSKSKKMFSFSGHLLDNLIKCGMKKGKCVNCFRPPDNKVKNTRFGCRVCLVRLCSERCMRNYHKRLYRKGLLVPALSLDIHRKKFNGHTLENLARFGMKPARCVGSSHLKGKVKITRLGCRTCLKRFCAKKCFETYHTECDHLEEIDTQTSSQKCQHVLDNLIKFGVRMGKCKTCLSEDRKKITRFGCQSCLVSLCSESCLKKYHQPTSTKGEEPSSSKATPKSVEIPKKPSHYVKHTSENLSKYGLTSGRCATCLWVKRKDTYTHNGCRICLKRLCSKKCFDAYHEKSSNVHQLSTAESLRENDKHSFENLIRYGIKGGQCKGCLYFLKVNRRTRFGCQACLTRFCSNNCLRKYHRKGPKSELPSEEKELQLTEEQQQTLAEEFQNHMHENLQVYGLKPGLCVNCVSAKQIKTETSSGCRICLKKLCSEECFKNYHEELTKNGTRALAIQEKTEISDGHVLDNLIKFGVKTGECKMCSRKKGKKSKKRLTRFGCRLCLVRLCSHKCLENFHTSFSEPEPQNEIDLSSVKEEPPENFYYPIETHVDDLNEETAEEQSEEYEVHVLENLVEHGLESGLCVPCSELNRKNSTPFGCRKCLKTLCSETCFENYHNEAFEPTFSYEPAGDCLEATSQDFQPVYILQQEEENEQESLPEFYESASAKHSVEDAHNQLSTTELHTDFEATESIFGTSASELGVVPGQEIVEESSFCEELDPVESNQGLKAVVSVDISEAFEEANATGDAKDYESATLDEPFIDFETLPIRKLFSMHKEPLKVKMPDSQIQRSEMQPLQNHSMGLGLTDPTAFSAKDSLLDSELTDYAGEYMPIPDSEYIQTTESGHFPILTSAYSIQSEQFELQENPGPCRLTSVGKLDMQPGIADPLQKELVTALEKISTKAAAEIAELCAETFLNEPHQGRDTMSPSGTYKDHLILEGIDDKQTTPTADLMDDCTRLSAGEYLNEFQPSSMSELLDSGM